MRRRATPHAVRSTSSDTSDEDDNVPLIDHQGRRVFKRRASEQEDIGTVGSTSGIGIGIRSGVRKRGHEDSRGQIEMEELELPGESREWMASAQEREAKLRLRKNTGGNRETALDEVRFCSPSCYKSR